VEKMTETITPTIKLTESAIKELLILSAKENNKPIRVGVKGGGCSGLSYVLEFDDRNDFDEEFVVDGLRVVVDKRHAMYLMGMEVDYQFGLNDRGFIFRNPNATNTCGCGTSFST
jgi:iron-sulfur cluster assembly protein